MTVVPSHFVEAIPHSSAEFIISECRHGSWNREFQHIVVRVLITQLARIEEVKILVKLGNTKTGKIHNFLSGGNPCNH